MVLIAVVALVGTQVVMIATSNAEGLTTQGTSGDISVVILPAANERAFAALVCNNGTDDVISFVLDMEYINYVPEELLALPPSFAGSNPTNHGTFDGNTNTWTGLIAATQCVAIGFIGDVTGAIGELIEVTATITSSTLGDSTPNIDPDNSNDSFTYTTDPIAPDPDITLATRLLTSGEIEAGDTVQYELTISNIGEGAYIEDMSMPLGVYFIIPEGTTFVGVTDSNLDDELDIADCGALDPSFLPPAFDGLTAQLVGCQLDSSTDQLPAGSSYKLVFSMTASGPFASGNTQVLAVAVANDADSLALQVYMFTPGADPFAIDTNNTNILTYNGDPLTATVDRCDGTGEVVNVDDACFTVTFNKPIHEPDFTAEDIIISGGTGEVYFFEKTGENQWTIRINGMTPGGTITLSLAESGIQDLSAVFNETQVLGINTVRYEIETAQDGSGNQNSDGSTATTGTLPATGAETLLWQLALVMLLLGTSLVLGSNANRINALKKLK